MISSLLLYSQVEQALDKVTEIRQEIGEKQCECIHVQYMYMYTHVCFLVHVCGSTLFCYPMIYIYMCYMYMYIYTCI